MRVTRGVDGWVRADFFSEVEDNAESNRDEEYEDYYEEDDDLKTLQSCSRRWWRRMRLSPDLPSQTLRYESSLHPQPPKESGWVRADFFSEVEDNAESNRDEEYEDYYEEDDDFEDPAELFSQVVETYEAFPDLPSQTLRMVYPSYRNPYSLQYSRPGYLLSRPRLGLTVFPRPDCRTTLSLGLPCPVAHGPLVRLNPLCSLQFLSVS
ncbi:hypothetical protein DPEC_G00239310 [Dallia pectoralis]|uniref:Uncharacterized protein n=1 Tax=Dallia pectoralis TaxID=75939 RepID=A0ACC2FZ69_DALPE|nr:hypothetical protein DPEC_G00239310 [Dallia pectoralis]